MTPGWWDCTEEEYHSSALLSRSGLVRYAESPGLLELQERETPAMAFGRLAHVAVLEPGRFLREYAEMPRVSLPPRPDSRAKAVVAEYKAECESLKAEALAPVAGKSLVSPADWGRLRGIMHAVSTHRDVCRLLDEATVERAARWYDEESGVPLRGRLDGYVGDRPFDLKTTSDTPSPENIVHMIARYKLHWQAAMYQDAYDACSGREPDGFRFIFVRSSAPYEVCLCVLDSESIELGRREYRSALRRYARSQHEAEWASGEWVVGLPGYVFAKSKDWVPENA